MDCSIIVEGLHISFKLWFFLQRLHSSCFVKCESFLLLLLQMIGLVAWLLRTHVRDTLEAFSKFVTTSLLIFLCFESFLTFAYNEILVFFICIYIGNHSSPYRAQSRGGISGVDLAGWWHISSMAAFSVWRPLVWSISSLHWFVYESDSFRFLRFPFPLEPHPFSPLFPCWFWRICSYPFFESMPFGGGMWTCLHYVWLVSWITFSLCFLMHVVYRLQLTLLYERAISGVPFPSRIEMI